MQSISVISSSHHIIQTFLSEATALGIRVPQILELSPRQANIAEKVEQFLQHLHQDAPAIALIVTSAEAAAIAEHLKHSSLTTRPLWLIGSLGLDPNKLSAWKRVFHGGVFVEPHMPELQEFKEYFIRSLQDPTHDMRNVIQEYKEEMFGCARNPRSVSGHFLLPCDSIPYHELELRFQQDPEVSFIVKAVSALTAAFRLVQLDHCSDDVRASCLRTVHDDLHDNIQGSLRKLSFSSMMPSKGGPSLELDGSQHHFTRNGKLVANKQVIYLIDRQQRDPEVVRFFQRLFQPVTYTVSCFRWAGTLRTRGCT